MIKNLNKEEWKEYVLKHKIKFRYAVSNYGRLMSFTDSFDDGRILKGSTSDGYRVLSYRANVRKKSRCFAVSLHKIVAELFLKKKDTDAMVIHLDYNKANNVISNLKWVSREVWLEHYRKNPSVIQARLDTVERNKNRRKGHKLTVTQVKYIKKRIFDPKRTTRMKMIAKQFNISEMQLYRIKSGENWAHVKYEP